jgi:pyruvate dehydrogenase E2 component (dihydrolipoamide acetyltransferase)
MPQMGLEVTEGTVAALHVAPGAQVDSGDLLLELETDKALTEIAAPCAGTVARIDVSVGDTVALGVPLLLITDGSDGDLEVSAPAAPDRAETSEPDRGEAPEPDRAEVARPDRAEGPEPARNGHGRLRAAPIARRVAAELGVAMESIQGTGPRGRITRADVERAAAADPAPAAAPAPTAGPAAAPAPTSPAADGFVELIALSATRRAIARRMTASQAIPQFSLEREIDATWLLASKQALPQPEGAAARSGVNDMLAQALGELLLRHPALATSYVSDGPSGPSLGRRERADVGLAVATDRGLMVPVLRRAHERPLHELAAERVRLVGAARSGRLTLQDMSGAAVTISNLGGFGVDRFVAMLNPGEAAILAVGRPVDRVRPDGRGFALVATLSLSLTVDHRVIDGAAGAQALAELCDLLEGEMQWRP